MNSIQAPGAIYGRWCPFFSPIKIEMRCEKCDFFLITAGPTGQARVEFFCKKKICLHPNPSNQNASLVHSIQTKSYRSYQTSISPEYLVKPCLDMSWIWRIRENVVVKTFLFFPEGILFLQTTISNTYGISLATLAKPMGFFFPMMYLDVILPHQSRLRACRSQMIILSGRSPIFIIF